LKIKAVNSGLGNGEMTGKNCGMLRKFRVWERENDRKKFRYSGKFPSKGEKKSSGE
jgi:hypothetical protein